MNDKLAPESHDAKVDSCLFPTWIIAGITGRMPLLFSEQNAEFASALCCGSSDPLSSMMPPATAFDSTRLVSAIFHHKFSSQATKAEFQFFGLFTSCLTGHLQELLAFPQGLVTIFQWTIMTSLLVGTVVSKG